tara:strand:- start:3104 stop:4204 length:1101 start_codon:yes stop_codon:yes gene_type:complete
MSVAINGTDGITFNDGSLQPSAPVGRNLIINGDMAIDQRNVGASATSNGSVYTVDRFEFQMSSVTNVQTYQQVTDAPAGFNKSLKITNNSTTQATAAGVLCTPRQKIEGLNTAYLNWGTSDAQTVTVSFWVKASVTGTYPVALTNNNFSRSFVTNYTVSVANTWEYKTVTIAGDTSGTWTVDTTTGINVLFSLDTGSTYQTTAGSWQAGNYRGTSSDVHFLANASATWQITGVQLEANTTATPFENLQYTTQLQLCQRYLPAFSGISNWFGFGIIINTSRLFSTATYKVPTRVAPTGLVISSASHFQCGDMIATSNLASAISISSSGTDSALLDVTSSVANLTAARPGVVVPTSASALIYFTGCEL